MHITLIVMETYKLMMHNFKLESSCHNTLYDCISIETLLVSWATLINAIVSTSGLLHC